MTQNVDRETVVSRLLGTDDILILCHKNPDGDTIGSGAALCKALQHLGKTAAVLCSDPIPAMYDYMQITVYDGSFTPAFVVAVDVAGIQLFGDHNNIQDYAEHVDLCIDHHGSNTKYAKHYVIRPEAASTTEIMYDLLFTMETEITSQIADCIYTGITTDTGCFRYTNATSRTYIVAAHMMDKGADVFFGDASAVDSGARQAIDEYNAAQGSVKVFDIAQPADLLGQNECIIGSQVTDNSAMVGACMEAVEAGKLGGDVIYGTLENGALSAGAVADIVPAEVKEQYAAYIEEMKAGTFMK